MQLTSITEKLQSIFYVTKDTAEQQFSKCEACFRSVVQKGHSECCMEDDSWTKNEGRKKNQQLPAIVWIRDDEGLN